MKAGYDAYKFIDASGVASAASQGSQAAGGSSGSLFGIQVSIGSSKTQAKSQESQETQRGTNLQAKDIELVAREGDLTATGAKVQAENITLEAARNITLAAARNSQSQNSSQNGSSVSLGVTFGTGDQNGFSIQIGANNTQAKVNGSETRWDNTLVTATNTLTLKSGADTTLAGAQLGGKTVKADIGGNFLIETLQDQSDFKLSQSSGGFGISLCIPPICYGTFATGTLNLAKTALDHNYVSAVGQSGIAAGSGGFDITVQGKTDLKGGAITSTAPADQNRLSTGSLTFSDLANAQNTNSESSSLSLGYGGGSALSTLASNAVANGVANLAGPGGLPKNGRESSQTLSVISPANITITSGDEASRQAAETLTGRDAATANQSLKNTLTLQDAAQIQADMKKAQENAQAAQMVGSVVFGIVGDISKTQYQKAVEEAIARGESPSSVTAWTESSPEKIALHGIAGLIQASVGGQNAAAGAVAAMANEALTKTVNDYIKEQFPIPAGASDDEQRQIMQSRKELGEAAAQLIGAASVSAVGGTARDAQQGALVALTADQFNRQLHTKEIDALKAAAKKQAADDAQKNGLTPEQQKTVEDYWFDQLSAEALAQVDAKGAQARDSFIAQLVQADPAKANNYLRDAQTARDMVSSMAGSTILNTDGKPIIADGSELHAFQASAAQYQDSRLFLTNDSALLAKQFGSKEAADASNAAQSFRDNKESAVGRLYRNNTLLNAYKAPSEGVEAIAPEM